MPKNFTGEVLHFGAIRFRVNGSGNLKTDLVSLNDAVNEAEPDIALATAPANEPTILANFSSQMAYVYGRVSTIDEYFNIGRIVVYVRTTASGYPG